MNSLADSYLFKTTTLFLLLFNAFLSVMQQLPLVFLGVPTLSSQLGLLPLVSLRALFVLLLQTLEVPPQGGLTRYIEDWTNEGKDFGTLISTRELMSTIHTSVIETINCNYLDSLSSPRFSSSSSLPLYSYSVSSIRKKKQQYAPVDHCPWQENIRWLSIKFFLTFLSSFLACTVNMVFELDSDLALSGLISDEGVLEQLLCGWSAGICLHETALYKVNEFLGPGMKGKFRGW